jgi:hypothetical protein
MDNGVNPEHLEKNLSHTDNILHNFPHGLPWDLTVVSGAAKHLSYGTAHGKTFYFYKLQLLLSRIPYVCFSARILP